MARFPPPLTKDEEAELFKHFDAETREELILRNLRLVAYIAKKYKTNVQDYEEFISIGVIGLIKAADTFDPSNKSRASFSTYAIRCIQNEILMAIRKAKKHNRCVSLETPISTNSGNGKEMTVEDTLALESYSIDEEVQNSAVIDTALSFLTDRERFIIERRFGLGGSDILLQRELSPVVGLTRSNIARIEKKALDKMRDFLWK